MPGVGKMMDNVMAIASGLLVSPYMAALGALTVLALALLMMGALFWAIFGQLRHLKAWLADRSLARDQTVDLRLMLARSASGRARKAQKYVGTALEAHLSKFIFGTPVRLVPISSVRTSDFARRRRRADAEGLLSVAIERRGKQQVLRLQGAARNGSGQDDHLIDVYINAGSKEWTEDLAPALAYKVATLVQPALKQPEDFRQDRVEELALALWGMLTAEAALPAELRRDLERDFCRCALHLAAENKESTWLDRVIETRRRHIEDTLPPCEAYRTEAQLDLGRALIAKSAARFNAQMLREGVTHLNQAIDIMRKNATIQQAEQANEAIKQANALMSARQRFSVTGGGSV